jgi:hypothetical protein
MEIVSIIMTHWGGGDHNDLQAYRRYYVSHYDHVRTIIPREQLLEFESKDGWEPLCKFLGEAVPDDPYPRTNKASQTVKLHHFLFWLRVAKLLHRPALAALSMGVLSWAVWWATVK